MDFTRIRFDEATQTIRGEYIDDPDGTEIILTEHQFDQYINDLKEQLRIAENLKNSPLVIWERMA